MAERSTTPPAAGAPHATWVARASFVAGVTAAAELLTDAVLATPFGESAPLAVVVDALALAALVGLADIAFNWSRARIAAAVRDAGTLAVTVFAFDTVLPPLLEEWLGGDHTPGLLIGAAALAAVAAWVAGWLRYLDEQGQAENLAESAMPVRPMIVATCVTALLLVAVPVLSAAHKALADAEDRLVPEILSLAERRLTLSERIAGLSRDDGRTRGELRNAIAQAEEQNRRLAAILAVAPESAAPLRTPALAASHAALIRHANAVADAADEAGRLTAAAALQRAVAGERVLMGGAVASIGQAFDRSRQEHATRTAVRLAIAPVLLFALTLALVWPLIALLIKQQRALVERLAVWKAGREVQRKVEEKFKSFTEIAADWCWETDAQLRFVSVTEGFTTLMHWHPSWLYVQALHDLQRLNTRFARSKSAELQIARREHFRDHCVIMLSAEGAPRFVRLHARAQRDADGVFTGYFGTATDITEGMQQAQLNEQADRLQSLGTMAAGLAHEFNNVLGIIAGHSELAKSALERGTAGAADLEPVLEASRRGARLTKSLLSFGRKRADGGAARVEIAGLLHELHLFLKPLIGPAYALNMVEAEEDLAVLVNKDVLVQAVVNLVLNARDAMPNGGSITVRASRSGGTPDRIELAVVDEGAGIPPHLIDKIFDPFFTTKDVGKGTGLGLPLVFRFAKDHGGEVRVTSKVGEGSTFALILPLTSERPVPGQAQPEGSAGGFDGLKALVVDDEPALGAAFAAMLRALRFEVTVFSDPNRALAALDDETLSFDVMISDVLMPGIDGPKLAELARALRPELKILFVTGQTERMGEDVTRGLEDIPSLGKPFEQAALAAALSRLLASSRAAAAA